MWWVLGYVALLAYAAVIFTYSATRERWAAALGTLLGVAGLQLAVLNTLAPWAAVIITTIGLLMVARDVVATLAQRSLPRAALVPARIRTHDPRTLY